jgi:predicted XRE-type DNA-binding protein
MGTKMRRTYGNVFADLGFSPSEAENLKVRADLMNRLARVIDSRRLTQAQAARLFGISQPRVSDLTRGKIGRFSVDTLIEMLGHAGLEVNVTTRARRQVA